MKILIYGINFWPELTGIGKYSGELAFWLDNKRHEVRVITAPPYYPSWKVGNGYSTFRYSKERLFNGGQVWRCPLWVPSSPSGLKRIIHLLSFAFFSFPLALAQIFWRPNVVVVVEPSFFCVPSALLVAFLSRAKSWLHIQDFEIDAAFELGIIKFNFLKKLCLFTEKILMDRFCKISTISEKMMDRLSIKNVKKDKIVFFPNWVDLDLIKPEYGNNVFRKEFNIDDSTIVALYSGNMGEKQGLEIIIEAAQYFHSNDRIIFVMCGDGSSRAQLKEKATGLKNVIWLPLQPTSRLNDLLNMADLHLLPQRSGTEDLVMPSKLVGMLASGRPIVATAGEGTQVAALVKDFGYVTPPGNLYKFVNSIHSLAFNADMRKQFGQRAHLYATKCLGRESVLGMFEKELTVLLDK